jgi:repressor LexA
MIGLTHRQAALLRFVCGFIEARGAAPTILEIETGAQTSGRHATYDRLNALQERGYIARQPGKARAIEVLHPIPIPRAPDGQPLYFVKVS